MGEGGGGLYMGFYGNCHCVAKNLCLVVNLLSIFFLFSS